MIRSMAVAALFLTSAALRDEELAEPAIDTLLVTDHQVVRGVVRSCSPAAVIIFTHDHEEAFDPQSIKSIQMRSGVSCNLALAQGLPEAPAAGTGAPNLAAPSRATAASAVGDRQVVPVGYWYGWKTLTADGVAIGLFVIAGAHVNSENSAVATGLLVGSGVLIYFAGAPIIHAQNQPGTAGYSVGLRVLAPLVSAVIGAGIGSAASKPCTNCFFNGSDYDAIGGAALGFAAGMFIAMVVDGTVLARVRAQDDTPKAHATPPATEEAPPTIGMSIVPLVPSHANAMNSRGGIALVGRF